MNRTGHYRSYSTLVKQEISRTGNIYLFPDLQIPRTTAQYWAKRRLADEQNSAPEVDSLYKSKAEFLTSELEKERALRRLLEETRRTFPFDFSSKHFKNKAGRARIVAAVRECNKYHSIGRCLAVIGLSKSSYQRWASEAAFCARTKSPCERRQHSQLTIDDVATMKRFVTSKKYAHISISSLQLLAQRSGRLFCSLETWYKYIRHYEWKRPWLVDRKKTTKVGIRANQPNEIWHLDVTVISVRPGYKLFIQAVIDNYSRFVLAWRITEEISAKNTIQTIDLAKKCATKLLSSPVSTTVMMDPGVENDNCTVLNFTTSANLIRTLARVDVHYSNSMVESLFRMFKNNYLYHQEIRTIEDLTRKADFYFRQHNEVVPLAVHSGGTPSEVFRRSWGEAQKQEMQELKLAAFANRKLKNLAPACRVCPTLGDTR